MVFKSVFAYRTAQEHSQRERERREREEQERRDRDVEQFSRGAQVRVDQLTEKFNGAQADGFATGARVQVQQLERSREAGLFTRGAQEAIQTLQLKRNEKDADLFAEDAKSRVGALQERLEQFRKVEGAQQPERALVPQPGPRPIRPEGFVSRGPQGGIIQDVFKQVVGVAEATELIGGRLVQAAEPILATEAVGLGAGLLAGPAGLAATGVVAGLGAAGVGVGIPDRFNLSRTPEQAAKLPADFDIAVRGAIGGDEDRELLRQRLTEIGLPERIIGGFLLDPLNFIPIVGFTKVDDFVRAFNAIRRGGKAIDDVPEARTLINALSQADNAPDAVGIRAAGEGVSEADNVAGLGSLGAEGLDIEPAAERLTRYMGEKGGPFQRALKERAGGISESRAAKSSRMAKIFADESLTPQQQFDQATQALRGADAPGADFVRPPMIETDVAELLTTVREHPLLQARVFEKRNTQSALIKLLDGELPQAAEWKLLERVFGPEFASAGARQTQSSWRVVADLLNLPRTLRTIFDHSWPLRQGIGVIARHPKETIGNLPQGLWSMASKRGGVLSRVSRRSFEQWDEAMRSKSQVIQVTDAGGSTKPWTIAELQDDSKLFLPKMKEVTGELAERTEEFLPTQGDSWVGRFFGPVVEPFQRSFLAHGNLTRSDIFENTLRGWTNGFTEPINRNDVDGLSWLLNVATGRGDLGGFNKYSPVFAGIMFSPRLAASRVEHALSPALLAAGKLGVPQSGKAANLAAQQLVSFIGAGISILTLASLTGVARVETNPISSLWGKLEFFRDPENPGGETQKLDLFGGYQQYARVIAQLLTLKGKSDLGVISKRDRLQVLEQFALNKLAPVPSLARSAATGETTIGQPVDLESLAGVKDFLWDGLSPLSFNDIEEAVGIDSPWQAAAGVGIAGTFGELGASANTYAPRITQQLNNIPQYVVPAMEKPFTAQELGQSRDLEDDVDAYLDDIVGQIGIDAQKAAEKKLGGRDFNVKYVGGQKGYSQRVIDAAIFFRSTKNQTKYRNPEWYEFVFNNQEILKRDAPWVFRNRETQDYIFQRSQVTE